MVGLHVQLDVEYASDAKLIDAGPMAELLYVRALCFAKRTMLDGKISHNQLIALAHGIPSPAKHAQRLVATGAFNATRDGYQVAGWLKRNKSAAKIRAESERKTREALERNHERWHVKEGKLNATCDLCYPDDNGHRKDQSTDQSTDPRSERSSDSTEVKAEAEAQPEAEVKAEVKAEASSSSVRPELKVVPADPKDDDDFTRTVKIILRAKENDTQPHSPRGWRITVRADIHAEHGEEIRRLLALDMDPVAIAAHILESKSAAIFAASQLGLPA